MQGNNNRAHGGMSVVSQLGRGDRSIASRLGHRCGRSSGAEGAEGVVAGTSPAELVIGVTGAAIDDAEEADGVVGGVSRDSWVVVVV